MFGTWAKALFVYLAVSFVLNETGKTEAKQMEEFGCLFENEEYKLRRKDPVWSELIGREDLTFTTDGEWTKFKDAIDNTFRHVMGNYPLNNVDPFIRFIQAYKNRPDQNQTLETFFNDYHVPFQPLEAHVSFLVEINSELAKLNSSAMNHMYIVSAYVDPPESFWQDKVFAQVDDESFSSEYDKIARIKLTEYRFQKHIAGVIKIQIHEYGRLSGERGIILLDPGYMNEEEQVYPYSAVLMKPKWETAKLELNEVPVFGLKRDEIVDSYLGKKFALVSIKRALCQVCEYKVLYLQYKPFCSFIDSTTKGNLWSIQVGNVNQKSADSFFCGWS
uniref:Uncharacterized protein n=1 Tax=Cacopsylla melanoneura TaxID=428564 RepID=A0A8D8LTZ2_9HEMI